MFKFILIVVVILGVSIYLLFKATDKSIKASDADFETLKNKCLNIQNMDDWGVCYNEGIKFEQKYWHKLTGNQVSQIKGILMTKRYELTLPTLN